MKTNRVDIRLEPSLLETLDRVRRNHSRSEWIRQALRASIPKEAETTLYYVEQPNCGGETVYHSYMACSPIHARIIHSMLTGEDIENSQDWVIRRATS